jgi:hypothetical protein
VQVGTSGEHNMTAHRGSKACVTRTRENQKSKKVRTLFEFGARKSATGLGHRQNIAAPAAILNAPGLASSSSENLTDTIQKHLDILLEPEPELGNLTGLGGLNATLGSSKSLEAKPETCDRARELVLRLYAASRTLPLSVPHATLTDAFAVFGIDPSCSAASKAPDTELWEKLDPMLNKTIGYDASIEEISSRIRRGPLGLDGLVEFLLWFVENRGLKVELIEGKVERLLDAIELW